MEEPPKIERIIASQGLSLADTATILTSYLSKIDQFHHHTTEIPPISKKDESATPTKEGDEAGDSKKKERKSRQEREEEALIAQMDQLANNKSASGMISDDVYERLKMITKSICAEVNGEPYSASGVKDTPDQGDANGEGDNDAAAGGDDFLAELEEAERLEQEEKQQQQQQPEQTKRDKKKEKKAKKAAKKAKKEAKRKAKELDDVDDSTAKKAKVES